MGLFLKITEKYTFMYIYPKYARDDNIIRLFPHVYGCFSSRRRSGRKTPFCFVVNMMVTIQLSKQTIHFLFVIIYLLLSRFFICGRI